MDTHHRACQVAQWAEGHDWARAAVATTEGTNPDGSPRYAVAVYLARMEEADSDPVYMGGHVQPDRVQPIIGKAVFYSFGKLRDWAGY